MRPAVTGFQPCPGCHVTLLTVPQTASVLTHAGTVMRRPCVQHATRQAESTQVRRVPPLPEAPPPVRMGHVQMGPM